MDMERVSEELAALASSFARSEGRTSIYGADLQRAQAAQQLRRRESTSEQGMAGLGNFLGVMGAAGDQNLDPMQYMALSNISSDASDEQIAEIAGRMGMDPKMATDLVRNKDRNFEAGIEALGLPPEYALAFSRERGMTTEQALGLEKGTEGLDDQADRIKTTKDDTKLPAGATGAAEFSTAIQKANVEINTFNAGFGKINTINDQYRRGLLNLMKAFDEARRVLEGKAADSGVVQNPSAPVTGSGDMDARYPRIDGEMRDWILYGG
jgi:hypothetical protein